ncbi:MAG: urease accessory protein UreF [Halobacteriales archaeon]
MTVASTLAALRLGDSFLPTGGDSLSYGLEQLVADDRVADAADLRRLLAVRLRHQVGPGDAVAVGAAHAAAADLEQVARIDRRIAALTIAPEFREGSERAGRRLLDVADGTADDPRPGEYAGMVDAGEAPGTHAAVFGLVAAVEGLPREGATAAFVHAFVTGQLAAAQRLLRIGHTDVQDVLADLRPAMAAAVEEGTDRTAEEMAAFTPLLDVASARHEHADRRLFAN